MGEYEIDTMFKAAFGMSDARYARFKAICPGGGTVELVSRLLAAPKDRWAHEIEQHAVERAQEACTEYKDGDLLYRNGYFFWTLYGHEFEDALKSIRCRKRRTLMSTAGAAFTAEIDRIRNRRLGPPELRKDLNTDTLDYGLTLGELMERRAAV